MRRRRALIVALAAVTGALALSTNALGFFAGLGTGEGKAPIGTLSVPTITTAAATAGTVTLAWEAAKEPNGPVTYYVTRDGGTPAGNCPTGAEPEKAVTACTDEGLEPGTYTYVVTATFRSWTATSEPVSVKVTAGPANHFVLSAASTTPSAGAADNLTITVKNYKGATVTSYTGEHELTFEGAEAIGTYKPTVASNGGAAVAFGSATKIKFTAGVASVTSSKNGVMKLYKAGPTTISVSDGTIETEVDLTVTVAPLAMSKLGLEAAATTPAAGSEDALTTTAYDTYGNVATSYAGSRNLKYSGPVASPNGTAPTVTDKNGREVAIGTATPTEFTEGVATAEEGENGVLRLYKAAAANIKVAQGATTSATVTITAAPAAPASLSLAAATTTPTGGGTDNLTTTALDAYGNTATSYAGSREIIFSGLEPSPDETTATVLDSAGNAVPVGEPTALTFSAGVATGGSSKNGVLKPADAGGASLAASDGTIATATPLALTVAAGAAAKLAWASPTISAGALGAPCLFTCAITGLGNGGTFVGKVAVTDELGNVVSNLGSGHKVSVTATAGSTVTGGSLKIASSGAAESTTSFTYKSTASGSFADTITAARSAGTTYASATATTSG